MKIYISCDISDLLSAEAKMALEQRLPEFAAKTLAAALRDKAENNARNIIGNGGFGQELAEGIRIKTAGPAVTIDHTSNDTNHLAEHVHAGGTIRPRYRKYLAIPIDRSVKKMYPSDYTGDLVLIRDGARAYLAKPMKRKVKPLWVLKRQVYQKPRPWWPSDDDFFELTEREFKWWFDKYVSPRQIL